MISETSMAALLMEPRPRPVTVTRGEIPIQWGGQEFIYRAVKSEISDETALWRLPEGTKCEFRCYPENIGRALIVTGGGPYCWAEEPVLLGYNAESKDIKAAKQKKKRRNQVAREFFENQSTPEPSWKDEAAERRQDNVVPLRIAVGAEELSEDEAEEPGTGSRGATPVTVMHRFDRKTGSGGKKGLRLAKPAAIPVHDEFVEEVTLIDARDLTNDDDDWVE